MSSRYLEEGRKALAIGAWEDAKALFEREVAVRESAEALEELAWANWWLLNVEAVFDLRTKAYQSFIKENNKRGASRTASWLGLDSLEFNNEFAVANGWFQRAENLLEGVEPCSELVLIRTLKANLAFRVEKNSDRAISILDETIMMSKQLNDMEGLMLAEALKGFILVTQGQVTEGMQFLDEATLLALNDEGGNIHSITTTCCFLIDACQRVRDFDRAGQWCNKVKEICKRWRHRAVFATCRTQYANVLIWQGEWGEAESELVAATNELRDFKPTGIGMSTIRLAELKRRQGKWEECEKLLNEVKSHSLKSLCASELAYDQGKHEIALDQCQQYLQKIPAHERTERIAGLELLLRIHVKLGNTTEAELVMTEINEIVGIIDTGPMKVAQLNAMGILELTKGKPGVARTYLEEAIDQYEELKSPFESARSRLTLAAALEQLQQFSVARSEIEIALKNFRALGASKDVEGAKDRLSLFTKGPMHENDFTKREFDILRLIAQGKNNDQIAENLFVSVRTVEKHLSNIYQKLGVSGKSARAFAASYAAKRLTINIHDS